MSDTLSPTARRTRRKLLDGARRAVEEHGIRALTVEQVLRAASVSRRTFYQYFQSRDDLVLAIYEEVLSSLEATIRTAIEAEPDPVQRLGAGIDAYLDLQQGGGRLITLLQAEAASPASNLWAARERAVDSLVALLAAQIRSVTGVAQDRKLYRILLLGLESQVIHVRRGGELTQASRDEIAELIKAMFIATIAGHGFLPKEPAGA